MAPLPPTIPAKFTQWPNYADIQSAYDRCLHEERRLMGLHSQTVNTPLQLISVRLLGYLFHHAPTDVAVDALVTEIHSCRANESLSDVGDLYLRALMSVFRAAKRRTLIPYNYASRPSFNTSSDMIKDYLEPAPLSHATAKKKALVRDGFRCVVTGKYDLAWPDNNPQLLDRFSSGELTFDDVTHTQCAHIISEFTNTNIEPDSNKLECASSMGIVMHRLGYTTLPDDLNGANIHRLENVMTLDPGIHQFFDSLNMWFVATNTEHTYTIEAIPTVALFLRAYPTVTFTTSQPGLPLPSPEYLSIHATFAKVAYFSGALGWFQENDCDDEEHFHKTLASDGSSASLLHNLLWVHANQGNKTV